MNTCFDGYVRWDYDGGCPGDLGILELSLTKYARMPLGKLKSLTPYSFIVSFSEV